MKIGKNSRLSCTHLIALGIVFGGAALPRIESEETWSDGELTAVLAEPAPAGSHADLARHWAPAFYADTDDSYYVGDYITHFNFDGDYVGKNNWQNLASRTTVPAYVYYAVSETETHYFLNYSVFHPRDWHEWLTPDMHENDLEGVSLLIEKGAGFGRLVAMETLAHDSFYQYGAEGVSGGTESLDGRIELDSGSHPRVFVEAKGHGLYGCDARCDSAPDGDGIVYVPGDQAESPSGGDGNYTRRYRYALIAMDADGAEDGNEGFWTRRHDICDSCTFGSWGHLRGDDHGTDKAKMPWVWRADEPGPVRAGDMLCDPAFFFDAHLNGSAFDNFSHVYLSHPFRTHASSVDRPEQRTTETWYAFAAGVGYRPDALSVASASRGHSYCLPSDEPRRTEEDGPLLSSLSSVFGPMLRLPRAVAVSSR